jgi:hypothetical protein
MAMTGQHEHFDVSEERHEAAERDAPRDRLRAAHEDDHGDDAIAAAFDESRCHGAGPREVDVRVDAARRDGFEPPRFVVFASERLQHAGSGERLLRTGGKFSLTLLDDRRAFMDFLQ